ncbi:MAG: DUF2306 domain-containing protein, partial [Planctomycetales bacterium]|nr:DUF2306 domain-containing protein [Planctomycetales bacterium]
TTACTMKSMNQDFYTTLPRLLAFLTSILILKVTANIVLEYRHYAPPDFEADFLQGRESYFWGVYAGAFYVHLLSGPVALVLSLALVSERLRRRAPQWHRRLGKVQVANILLLVAPSGLWMARYAMTGRVAGLGLASLAVATGICAFCGWRAALRRDFYWHERWMRRTFVLLCSAVVLRIIGGLATVAQFDAPWLYPASAWISWLLPLAIFEVWSRIIAPRNALVAAR